MLYVTKLSHSDQQTHSIVQLECLSAGQTLEEAQAYAEPYLLNYANTMLGCVLDGAIFTCEKYDVNKHKDTNRYHLVTP